MITIIAEQLALGNPTVFALIAVIFEPPVVIIAFEIIDFLKKGKKKK